MTSFEEQLAVILFSVTPTDPSADVRAWARLDDLTKPPRSLGRLEEIAAQVARVQDTEHPDVARKAILLMAGDHGVVAEGVSPYPQDVTWQMVANFTAGGAAINQIASSVGAEVLVYDVGVAKDLAELAGIVHVNVAHGTDNMAEGPAMSREECAAGGSGGSRGRSCRLRARGLAARHRRDGHRQHHRGRGAHGGADRRRTRATSSDEGPVSTTRGSRTRPRSCRAPCSSTGRR